MVKAKLPRVIAIAGVSGGGKTTVAKKLTAKLQKANVLYFDDYQFEGPEDIIDWVDRGANYNEWNLSPLISDINTLRDQQLDYIVLDFPFSYKNSAISPIIDFTIFIDTPLDIALARRVRRDFNNCSNEKILLEMENYILQGRRGYVEMLTSIKPNSDFIVDGTQSVSTIVESILIEISSC
ncbi:hypothetical protein WAK64_05915 [Bacillus spongiae]|uniref:Phosphoribulokinase/uridine kinase domain-containing protein n=1 Tax=Bacillus spongiae TaxID=2683610 RepID=A0ABU8HBA3_9BACI